MAAHKGDVLQGASRAVTGGHPWRAARGPHHDKVTMVRDCHASTIVDDNDHDLRAGEQLSAAYPTSAPRRQSMGMTQSASAAVHLDMASR
jgi:hypothetical protein